MGGVGMTEQMPAASETPATASIRGSSLRCCWLGRHWKPAAGIVVIAGIAAAAIVWRHGRQGDERPPQPPEISTEGLDPGVRLVVTAARDKVLAQPNSAEAWGRLGLWLTHLEQSLAADQCFIQAEKLAPDEPKWPVYRGQMLLDAGRPGEALACLRRAAGLPAPSPAARSVVMFRIAETLLDGQSSDEAEDILREELQSDPNSIRARYDLALAAFGRHDWHSANRAFFALTTSAFTRKKALVKLAVIARIEDHDQAALKYEEQAREAPEDRRWAGDPYGEEAGILVASVAAPFAKIDSAKEQGRREEAFRALLKLIDAEPTAKNFLIAGTYCMERQDPKQGERFFRKALQVDPDYPDALFTLAYLMFTTGQKLANDGLQTEEAARRYRECIELARHCIAVKPDYGTAYLVLGRALVFQKQSREAVKELRMAVKCRPDLPAAHLYLAEALWRSGEKNEAIRAARVARELAAPQDRELQTDMERIAQMIGLKSTP
jgi:tetratricopeptide (TPR) repeat protein